ncbi:hypothetical protein DJ39_2055 [Yersinia ruckeri ATCC 29473]|uniref:Uncharacterized protein n=1 Tax=Yersinia ruckeri TaxID=29486 RepID=A0A0A8VKY3_YERRU|nr:hypothetical protein QMA0440_01039 [Yersinia ruckeri]KGA51397.1 hypothetical protein DJ39_2055 [Yersinia ruckeri ATCC 29473]QTD77308.1 Uncharacterized protein YR821_2390 [Yersinia ruckeri]CEK28221.1 hypothetical protein CSF007_12410 [Yersinia ruckeri]CNH81742.1 Uncharacterised protein [Yersinia ruckeri]
MLIFKSTFELPSEMSQSHWRNNQAARVQTPRPSMVKGAG